MNEVKQYADRNPRALGQYYINHVSAMTKEGLHAKSDIAGELAFRDKRIDELEAELVRLREQKPAAYKLPVYPVRIVEYSDLNGCYAEGTVEPLYAEPKPEQLPAGLMQWIKWADYPINYSGNDYAQGYEDARAFVKSELEKR
jgi:hypothetical protein